MSREIKFRAWDDERKKWFPVIGMSWDKQTGKLVDVTVAIPLDNECHGHAYVPEPVENVMQFTGLKDKNGREIYEGDIVCVDPDSKALCPVEFAKGAFCIKAPWPKNETDPYNELNRYCNDVMGGWVTVIGNIFENPELILESKN